MFELRFAFRQLRKDPGFTAVVTVVLALGIGATTAMFSMINSALLQPLPYPDAEQLVDVMESYDGRKPNGSVSGGAFKDWHEHSESFANLAVSANMSRNLTGLGQPERIDGLRVSSEYLAVLGLVPQLGRWFAPEETAPGGNAKVVVLTHGFWQTRFGGDPAVLGRTVTLDQEAHTIVGVLPPRALLNDQVQLLLPEVIDAPGSNWGRDMHWRRVIGRLRPGVSVSAAETELRGIKQRLNPEYPVWKANWSVLVTSLQEIHVGRVRPMLVMLLGAVGLVLLIACANVSSLLLARGQARTREMAVRVALGAHPWRIVRQTLAETLLLAGAGCLAGWLFALASSRVLAVLVMEQLPEILHPRLNGTVLLFSVLIAGGCGVMIALLPAWRAVRVDAIGGLKEGEHGSASRARRHAQAVTVVAEIALTLVLLVGVGLFLRSFARLISVDPGFNPRGVLVFDLSFPRAKYPTDADRLRMTMTLIDRVRALPGVESVGSGSSLPLSGMERGEFLSRADRPEPENRYSVGVSSVGGDYLRGLGIPLLRGRYFTEADNSPTSPPVLVVDAGVVRDLFANEDPLGQQMRFLGRTCEIVGVVGPVHQRSFEQEPRPWAYGPQAHFPAAPSIVIRSDLAPAALIASVRAAIAGVDPDQPIANVRTLDQAVHRSLSGRRTALGLLAAFAVVAVGLACIGIYGVMAHAIGQRRREFSIRTALGAESGDIIRLVLSAALRPAGLGIVLGVAVAVACGRVLQNQLFQVQAYDPWVLASAVALLIVMAILSACLPARRAAAVSPAESLRAD